MGNVISSVHVRFEELRSLPAGAINKNTFTPIGLPFEYPVRILKITNLTDEDLYFSFNGETAQDVIASRGFCLYDYGSNRAKQPGFFEQAARTNIFVKAISAAPTVNSVHVTVIYASRN
jgi:hypothetical protein